MHNLIFIRITKQKIIFKWYPWPKQTSYTTKHVTQITVNIWQIVRVITIYINGNANRLHCHDHDHTAQFVQYYWLHQEFTEINLDFLQLKLLKVQSDLKNYSTRRTNMQLSKKMVEKSVCLCTHAPIHIYLVHIKYRKKIEQIPLI